MASPSSSNNNTTTTTTKKLSTTATNASDQIALINEYLTGPPAVELVRQIGLVHRQKARPAADAHAHPCASSTTLPASAPSPASGVAGFTSWNKISWWTDVLLPALKKHLPDAPPLPDPKALFPRPGLRLRAAGFVDVHSVVWGFVPDVDPKDFALACAHLAKSVAARAWNEEAKAKYLGEIEGAFLRFLEEEFDGGRWTGQDEGRVDVGAQG
ncbi:hypothetical protein DFJ73DRAFT_886162, partial [Zopfochytrium polystomum]